MKRFKDYSPAQQLPLPLDFNDWLEDGHLAYFIRDVVGQLYLREIYDDYHSPRGGQRADGGSDVDRAQCPCYQAPVEPVFKG